MSYDGARDVVRCGAGVDVVNADLPDTVTRDCELVGRRLSRDPYTTADAQHETEVEPDSFTFGRTTVATFQVGRRFDGAATNAGWAVTTNDGATWRSGLLPGLTTASSPPGRNARASDPVVAYDSAHATWLISTLALEGPTTRLEINRSANGATWSTAVTALEERADEGIAFDKNWLACEQHALLSVLRPLLPRLHALDGPGHARRELVDRRRAHVVRSRRHWCQTRSRRLPGHSADRRGRGRLSPARRRAVRDRVVAHDGRSRDLGRARPVSPRSTAVAGFETFARSRCRARRWIAPAACGRAGTTASRPVRRDRTPCSSDVDRRQPVERTDRSHARAERRAAGNRQRSGHGARRNRIPAGARRGNRCREGRITGFAGDLVARATTLGEVDAARVDAGHDVGPHAGRLHFRALRARTTSCRLGPRERAGRIATSARPSTRRAAEGG